MSLENNELYMTVAGYIFKFIFKIKSGPVDEKAKKYFISNFSPFIIQKKTAKIDYSIEFLDRDSAEGKQKKQDIKIRNDIFIKLCSENKKQKKITTFFPIVFYNFDLIMRHIFYNLLKKNHSFCMHSSAVVKNEKTAYLFLGKSGAGKSTVLKLLKKNMTPIYDDMGFIKKESNAYNLYITPYQEKNKYPKDNSRFTINKIFIIKKSPHFDIKKVPDTDLSSIIKIIASQILVNKNKRDIFDFIAKHRRDFYYLYFSNKDNDLANKLLLFTF